MSGWNGWLKKGFVLLIILTIMAAGLIIFCIVNQAGEEKKKRDSNVVLSAWIVDWKWQSGLENLAVMAPQLSSLQLFAAYFSAEDELYIREGYDAAISQIVQTARRSGLDQLYLTVVNDMIYENGSTLQKDTDLVTRLTVTEAVRSKLITDIVAQVEAYALNGVEIDFERVGEEAWPQVIAFYTELDRELRSRGKSIRVVLEPRVPFDELNLPAGPEYVIMAYNLYGFHSGPGPKADRSFINRLIARLDHVPGSPTIALATGGFSWGEERQVVALTEKQAVELSQKSEHDPLRDEESAAVFFQYVDEDGVVQHVWYADGQTLAYWIETARMAGIKQIALWRLGELEEETLEQLSQMY